jgi:hypothetical protein
LVGRSPYLLDHTIIPVQLDPVPEMSDTSYAAVSQLKRLVDIADDEWLQDHLSDDGIMELLWFSFAAINPASFTLLRN